MVRTKKSKLYLFLLLVTFALVSACSATPETGEAPSEAVCSAIIDAKSLQDTDLWRPWHQE
jgi:hypothetical protein